ncbi:hypothetical protein SAMN02745664_102141 [Moraxella cuniculi DSM 21768]|uniref:Uncharacterized protein n=2 Tax=Moraxella cuniculi TaxID=34061 RepID=A0A1N7DV33_9GAMM|nr:hypothetical protein [Moraxella cuniculi]SIR79673.1 hypothetical protein SAMN02745664_102141 [Moraxella cuniculi DSM 21768]VEG12595.1 Uncharacterised protein [Moraxella cuniculi]
MRLDFFYRYQAAELLLTTSIRTIGILFAWVMIDGLGLVQDLGEFIALSWLCQVLSLLIFGKISSRLQFDNKHLLLLFCFLTVVGLLALFYSQAIWLFATILSSLLYLLFY